MLLGEGRITPTTPLPCNEQFLKLFYMSQGFDYGLRCVIISSLGNDMSVCLLVANDVHHGSHGVALERVAGF